MAISARLLSAEHENQQTALSMWFTVHHD